MKLGKRERPYFGEAPCEAKYKSSGEACRNVAYYEQDGRWLCGVHTDKNKRKDAFKKNPRAEEIRDAKMRERASVARETAATRLDQLHPLPCAITASPFGGMMKEWAFEPIPGWAPIFPNNKHGHGFSYGFGDFSVLSPMKLGPVVHGQRDLPLAMSIENYHQYNKVFSQDVKHMKDCDCPRSREWPHKRPAPCFYKLRFEGYRDPTPHRHKYPKEKGSAKNANIPLYSVHVDANGVERHYSYVESRYFYCNQMEMLALRSGAILRLVQMARAGFQLQIVGYDAYQPNGTDKETLYRHYCDPSRPFGHEVVILTLVLALYEGWIEEEVPWHRYWKEHQGIY
jgi:hypothetical protein